MLASSSLRTVAALAIVCLTVSYPGGGAAEADPSGDLTVRIVPRTVFAGRAVRLTVNVPPEPKNRMLIIAIDSEAFSASSSRELDGDHARRVFDFSWPSLPAGEYIVQVSVVARDGSDRTVARTLSVLNREGSTP